MAANSVSILIELAAHLPFPVPAAPGLVERYLHALNYAPGMGELRLEDWNELRVALENYPPADYDAGLRQLVLRVLQHQLAEWEGLGEPDSHENWAAAEFGGEE